MQQLLKVPQLTCATLKLLQLAVAKGHARADKDDDDDDDDADEDEVAKRLTGRRWSRRRRRMSSKTKKTLDLTTCSIEINLLKILMSIFAACNILLQVPHVHTFAAGVWHSAHR